MRSCEVCGVPLKSKRAWRCARCAKPKLGVKTKQRLTHAEVAAAVRSYVERGGVIRRLVPEVVTVRNGVAVHAPSEYEEFRDVDATFPVAIRTTADRLDPPRDHTMAEARAYGLLFSETQELPALLRRDRGIRAQLCLRLDADVVPSLHGGNLKELYQAFRACVADVHHPWQDRHHITEHEAISIGLRLWAGAICGAKLMAYQTRSGVNGRKQRERGSWALLPLVRQDRVFAAGVGCALELKRMRGQQVTLDGVHPDVRRILEGR